VASAPRTFPVTYNTTSSFGTYTYDVPSYSLSGSGTAMPAGTYYVTGNVSISGTNHSLAGVTVVATGTINISGTGQGPSSPAASNGVSFYSTSTSSTAIQISGTTGTWSGCIYAPNGGISFSGSSNTIKAGSLWGQAVTVSGSSWTLNPTSGTWGTPNVSLIQ
jgi:hypothetical protein